MTRIFTLTGVGDPLEVGRLAADLAPCLATAGRRVGLLALAGSAAGPPGAADTVTLENSLQTGRQASALPLADGCELIVGSRDPQWLASLSETQLLALAERLEHLTDYDILLIHTGPGSDPNTLAFALASPVLLLVITAAAESLCAAYSLLKILYAEQYPGRAGIIVDHCDRDAGQRAWEKLRGIASFYLEMPLSLAGTLAPRLAHAGEDYTAGLAQLADTILAGPGGEPVPDLATFSRGVLRAGGALPAADSGSPLTPVFTAVPREDDLHGQLEQLSGQIDALIAAVELRQQRAPGSRPAPAPGPAAAEDAQRCDPACMAAMASGAEAVSHAGQTFTVYHLRRSDGRQLRYACQSSDDDLEEPEPQSSLS